MYIISYIYNIHAEAQFEVWFYPDWGSRSLDPIPCSMQNYVGPPGFFTSPRQTK